MADGILVDGFPVLPAAHSANLDEPRDPIGPIALIGFGTPLAGTKTLADPRPYLFDLDGVLGPIEDLAIVDRIHVIPRRKDFGAVLTDQELEVEVWNAFQARAQILESITVEGPAGIEVDNPHALPTHFPATESKIYVVRVLAEGDPLIDNRVIWEFTGIDPQGTDLTLTGFRLIPWPFEPNFARSLVERYGYLTRVLESRKGVEQRIQLRELPVGSIEFANLFDDPREAQEANAILYGSQARPIGVPRWQFRTPLEATANADATELLCNPTDLPFHAGGLVFLWRDSRTWEAQRIASVEADRLVLELGLRADWPAAAEGVAGTWLIPMVFGRLADEVEVVWPNRDLVETELEFSIDAFKPDPATVGEAPDSLVGIDA